MKRIPVPDIEAVPPVIEVTHVTESCPPVWSTSVSFERTAMVTLVLRLVEPVSAFATGASLTQVTVIVPVAVLEAVGPKASLRRKVKVSVPQ